MKKTLKRSLRRQKRNLDNLSQVMTQIDEIKLHPKQYLKNLLATNQRLLNTNNVNNLLLF